MEVFCQGLKDWEIDKTRQGDGRRPAKTDLYRRLRRRWSKKKEDETEWSDYFLTKIEKSFDNAPAQMSCLVQTFVGASCAPSTSSSSKSSLSFHHCHRYQSHQSHRCLFIGPRSDHGLPMSLNDSLTDWLTDKLVEDWLNWPKYADYAG